MQPLIRFVAQALSSLVVVFCCALGGGAGALDTSFVYQGRLDHAGAPVSAQADFTFTLWNDAAAGTQVGPQQVALGLAVTGGLFTVALDFGSGAFNGEARWLQISVNGTTLAPRQALAAAPYALFALAGNEGPPGPPGEPGVAGEPGIVTGASVSSGGLAMTGSFNFLTSPVTVTIEEGEVIFVTASRALGTTSTSGATNLEVGPGYRNVAGGGVVAWGTVMGGLFCPMGDRRVYSVNGVITGLAAGTYEVGMVGRQGPGGTGSWNNNSAGQASALVFRQ